MSSTPEGYDVARGPRDESRQAIMGESLQDVVWNLESEVTDVPDRYAPLVKWAHSTNADVVDGMAEDAFRKLANEITDFACDVWDAPGFILSGEHGSASTIDITTYCVNRFDMPAQAVAFAGPGIEAIRGIEPKDVHTDDDVRDLVERIGHWWFAARAPFLEARMAVYDAAE